MMMYCMMVPYDTEMQRWVILEILRKHNLEATENIKWYTDAPFQSYKRDTYKGHSLPKGDNCIKFYFESIASFSYLTNALTESQMKMYKVTKKLSNRMGEYQMIYFE